MEARELIASGRQVVQALRQEFAAKRRFRERVAVPKFEPWSEVEGRHDLREVLRTERSLPEVLECQSRLV